MPEWKKKVVITSWQRNDIFRARIHAYIRIYGKTEKHPHVSHVPHVKFFLKRPLDLRL